jgi:monofunctional biosynthetic peptidoglycan transglycosylase
MRRGLTGLGVLAGSFAFWLLAVWPPPSWYRTHWPAETAFMVMRESAGSTSRLPVGPGSKSDRAAGQPVRRYRPVPLDSIAPYMQDAVMIGEDDNFLTHGGIDYLALAHALGYRRETLDWRDPRERRELLALLPSAWSKRDQLRGASTITQQLAKNLYLSPSRNPLRKLKEAVITWRLEAALGKRRIMELYLNLVELGDEVWGVEAASELYFQRHAREISREQAAALAGSLPFPLRSNPDLRPGRMRWRQNLILRRMRGEWVEIPKVVEEEIVPPESQAQDSLAPPPGDTLFLDTTSADSASPEPTRADTMPADIGPVSTPRPDSGYH